MYILQYLYKITLNYTNSVLQPNSNIILILQTDFDAIRKQQTYQFNYLLSFDRPSRIYAH